MFGRNLNLNLYVTMHHNQNRFFFVFTPLDLGTSLKTRFQECKCQDRSNVSGEISRSGSGDGRGQ